MLTLGSAVSAGSGFLVDALPLFFRVLGQIPVVVIEAFTTNLLAGL